MSFNINLDISASTDPSKPKPGSSIHARIPLGMIRIKNSKETIDILNSDSLILVSSRNTASFKLKYYIEPESLKGVKTYAYHLTGVYIDPKSGGLGFLTSEVRINNSEY